jgi:hypothetical protein
MYLGYTWRIPPLGRPMGSARIQRGARKRREVTGINRTIQTQERAARLLSQTARSRQTQPENQQLGAGI